MKNLIILFTLTFISCNSINNKTDEDLLYAKDVEDYGEAFFNQEGKKILGNYAIIYTDTLKDFAFVYDSDEGDILIDRTGKILYHIFRYDNGPDYTSEGFYRIIENGKIGYVDSATSKLVIPPIYDCAWPFENGKAKVSNDCREIPDGEYSRWESEKWFYIDKQGNIVKE